jgi:hypothetical protein
VAPGPKGLQVSDDCAGLVESMIEVGPRVFANEEWMTRRQRLPKVV